MSVNQALEKSAKAFNAKYACDFDFKIFESRVEEFTFLRPNGGWIDVYKAVFDRMYKNTLEKAAVGAVHDLDGEAMLDDFEYTLIRPYANENESEIRHKPYVGMDRIARLEYLDKLTKEAPSNPVDLFTEKYKSGEITVGDMKSAISLDKGERRVEIAGYIQALENANKSRSIVWRALHPFKNSTEKREASLMKKTFVDGVGGENAYREIALAAYETFEGHKRANENLAVDMIRAKEELNRMVKMNEAMKESIVIDGFDRESSEERSSRVDQPAKAAIEKQL